MEEDILKKIGDIHFQLDMFGCNQIILVNWKFLLSAQLPRFHLKYFSFNGFIAGLWLKNKLIEFTTYNFSKVKRCKINEREVEIIIESPKYILKILVYRSKTAKLAAPIQGFMDAKIDESMTSRIQVKLIEKKNKKNFTR